MTELTAEWINVGLNLLNFGMSTTVLVVLLTKWN